jgi:hypothetical protein
MILCEPLKPNLAIDPFQDTKNPSESSYSWFQTVTLESTKYCNPIYQEILMFESRIVKLRI